MPDRRFILEVDQYERDNLLWLLDVARQIGLDTGDWLKQLYAKLDPGADRRPNVDAKMTRELVERFKRAK